MPRRTTHDAHNGVPRLPAWGKGAEGPEHTDRARTQDANTRAAYPGQPLRSPYATRLALPDRVPPAHYPSCFSILERLEGLLAETGWTRPERFRLRGMRDAWSYRASGKDLAFNQYGWERKRRAPAPDVRLIDQLQDLRATIYGG